MVTRLFDRQTFRQRQQRADRQGRVDFLEQHAAKEALDRLTIVLRTFEAAALIGGAPKVLHDALLARPDVTRLIAIGDHASVSRQSPQNTINLIADEEALPLGDESVNLAVNLLSLSFVNDLPGALLQLRRALKPDGLFLGTFFGVESLRELRTAFRTAETQVLGGISPRVAPFLDVRDAGGLLQRAGFALPVIDSETLTVRYDTPLHLMRDLRGMGLTNMLADRLRAPMRRDLLAAMLDAYTAAHTDADGRIRATFELIHTSGWAPHNSQQQPLKPGSARARLADALSTREQPAGEKVPEKKPEEED